MDPARDPHDPPPAPAPSSWSSLTGRRGIVDGAAAAVVLFLLGMLFVARARRLSWINVNWDEFYFLSRIHELRRGELADVFLTFHTRLLAWVVDVGQDEVDQVIALRVVMALSAVVTAASAWTIGRRLGGTRATAALGALAGQSLSFVVLHGCAARFDPPLIALATMTLALLLVDRRSALVAAAVGYAMAFLITLKAGLYAPTVLVFLWLRPTNRRVNDVLVFGAVFFVVFGVLLGLHQATLAAPPPVVVASDGRSAGSMLARALPGGIVLQEQTLAVTLETDTVVWAALAVAFISLVASAGLDAARRRPALLALSLFAPLLGALGYRNSFAYFYVSIFPAAAVALGTALALAVDAATRRTSSSPATRDPTALAGSSAAPAGIAVVVVLAVFVVGLAVAFARPALALLDRQRNEVRTARAILAAVHAVFPDPVPYVDRCGMVASFPKVGPFMSTWGLEAYRAAGRADLPALLSTRQPQFVLANVGSLRLERPHDPRSRYALLAQDAAVLRENFVPHWGPLWVAGHVVDVPEASTASFLHAIPGAFRLESATPVLLDGVRVAPGDVVSLAAGRHTIADAAGGAVRVTLRTAQAGPPPTKPPPRRRLFQTLSREQR
jgi:hypothetical protein